MNATNETLLTAQQVCERLNIAMSTLRGLVKRGTMPVIKLGAKTWRYRQGDVESLLLKGVSPLADNGHRGNPVGTQLWNRFAEMRKEMHELQTKVDVLESKRSQRFEEYLEADRHFAKSVTG